MAYRYVLHSINLWAPWKQELFQNSMKFSLFCLQYNTFSPNETKEIKPQLQTISKRHNWEQIGNISHASSSPSKRNSHCLKEKDYSSPLPLWKLLTTQHCIVCKGSRRGPVPAGFAGHTDPLHIFHICFNLIKTILNSTKRATSKLPAENKMPFAILKSNYFLGGEDTIITSAKWG